MIVKDLDANAAKGLIDDIKKSEGSIIVAIASQSAEGKAGLYVGVTDDLKSTNSAIDLVRVGAAVLGGKGGGGRPDLAQAGGPDGSKVEAALEAIKSAIK
jgi:alanyl-tRNA synthetase